MDNSSLSHCKWKCQYHIVFIPRRKIVFGQTKADIREILKKLCEYKKVEIIEGAVCSDHVHLCVSIPPKLSVSEFVGYLKGKSDLMIFDKHPEHGTKWDRKFWARGYYVCTVGKHYRRCNKKVHSRTARRSKIRRDKKEIASLRDC